MKFACVPQILIVLHVILAARAPAALASYLDKDDRQILSKNLKVIGFTAEEQEQAMRCMGYIYCPGGKDGMGSQLSAGAVCPLGKRMNVGKCDADRLATVAHGFVDQKTNKFIRRLNECEFMNYRGHVSKLELKDIRTIQPNLDSKNPYLNMREDKVVIRLKRPIPGCDPFDLSDAPEVPVPGTEIVALTHLQEDQAGKFDGREPMAYLCQVTRSYRSKDGRAGVFYNNCDLNGGGSGGFSLIRGPFRELLLVGLFAQAGELKFNGQAYSEEIKNFTLSTGTNADFVLMLAEPGKKSYSDISSEQKYK